MSDYLAAAAAAEKLLADNGEGWTLEAAVAAVEASVAGGLAPAFLAVYAAEFERLREVERVMVEVDWADHARKFFAARRPGAEGETARAELLREIMEAGR